MTPMSPPAAGDGEAERAVQPDLACRREPREVRVLLHVRDPRGLSVCPDPAGQANAGGEGHALAHGGEVRQLHGRGVPDVTTAQDPLLAVDGPESRPVPAEALADGLQDGGHGPAERLGLRQHAGGRMLRRLTPALDGDMRRHLVQRALYLHELVAVNGIHRGRLDIALHHPPGHAGDALCALSDSADLRQREGGQSSPNGTAASIHRSGRRLATRASSASTEVSVSARARSSSLRYRLYNRKAAWTAVSPTTRNAMRRSLASGVASVQNFMVPYVWM